MDVDGADGTAGASDPVGRAAQLIGSLGALRSRIAEACAAAGRDSREITMIAVTKTYPATDVATLLRLGVADLGESKDQEAAAKVDAVAGLIVGIPEIDVVPRWHFVGQVQRRKARSVAGYAHAVHSVDRIVLVGALADAINRSERAPLDVFVQVSLDGDPARGGVAAASVAELADEIAASKHLVLRGVMAVAPAEADPDAAFASLAQISDQLRTAHPPADAISAGMSNDLEAAVRNGATHVRVGTALLGRRPPVFG